MSADERATSPGVVGSQVSDEDGSKADRLRAHLIAEHNFTADYFDEDYPIGGPIHDLSSLRWLHAPWVKNRDYPKGCDRDV